MNLAESLPHRFIGFMENETTPRTTAADNTQRNVNTLLLAATVGMLSFVAHTSVENGKDISAIKAGQVTHAEVEAKIAEVKLGLEVIRRDNAAIMERLVTVEASERVRSHHE